LVENPDLVFFRMNDDVHASWLVVLAFKRLLVRAKEEQQLLHVMSERFILRDGERGHCIFACNHRGDQPLADAELG
jgi:hypothetical protein